MERIKEALERARQERQHAGGGANGTPMPRGGVVPAQIAYTQTRHAEVSSEFLREKRVITGRDPDTFTDAYGILRTQVLQRLRENNWNVLAVTSPGGHEGKTLTTINLAISLAMEVGYTVLLVDADLRHPDVHTYFGLEPEYGLSDYLVSDKPISELLLKPAGIQGLVILPGGKPLPNSAEMLNSPKMSRLVEEFKTRYPSRIVLFDLPPLLATADAISFAPYVDAALLVLEEGKTPMHDAQRATELLKDTHLIGVVLNKSLSAPNDDKQPGWKPPQWNIPWSAGVGKIRQWIGRLARRKG
ncbi:MAG: CpsD/CapB family tyrosine-protein kinase [Sulfuricaulis sp.]|uniref:CpsD/CapB family tyrosine-protein kinase n=1 Tax=Sulfuricaulis sp. TaxID=2003553 RepID=UPI0025FB8D8A|nr:CpsD/CapB family tyrosine-protein kinase [Sulfuricaulis sp.]MCR4347337.1 CpsD/CapB family tyrosine-protein kinase [Sulfuricaulis sp.]